MAVLINKAHIPNTRKFRLIAPSGHIIDLMDTKTYATNIEGLGVSFSDVYLKTHTASSLVSRTPNLDPINLALITGWGDKPYLVMEEMLPIFNQPVLQLEYEIPDVGVFTRDVTVKSLKKGEMSQYSILALEIEFQPISIWYYWRQVLWGDRYQARQDYQITMKPDPVVTKRDKFWSSHELLSGQYCVINNQSKYMDPNATSALYLEIPVTIADVGGALFHVYKPNGDLIGSFKTTHNIITGGIVYICSDYKDMWVYYRYTLNDEEKLVNITPSISVDSIGLFRLDQGCTIIKLDDAVYTDPVSGNVNVKFAKSSEDDPKECVTVKIKEEWVLV